MKSARADNVAYAAVMALAAAGLFYSVWRSNHWLRGVAVIGVALGVAGILRIVLPESRAGMLAVRTRAFDAFCYLALAATVIGVGFVLPR